MFKLCELVEPEIVEMMHAIAEEDPGLLASVKTESQRETPTTKLGKRCQAPRDSVTLHCDDHFAEP